MKEVIRNYYTLTKPGVTYGNALSAVAGFLFATGSNLQPLPFVAFTLGITFVIASACATNNILDRDIDRLMARTKARVSVTGQVSPTGGILFAAALGLIGMGLITAFTTTLAAWVALFGFITYVVLYGMLAKRLSWHGTLVGSVSGAAPILSGYTAVTGHIDVAAVILFTVLFLWQMPEFYSIAIYRRTEYQAAGIPVITVVKGSGVAVRHIWWYTLAFLLATVALAYTAQAGITYLTVMSLLGIYWLRLASEGVLLSGDAAWARRMFRFSLYILLIFCGLISIESFLP